MKVTLNGSRLPEARRAAATSSVKKEATRRPAVEMGRGEGEEPSVKVRLGRSLGLYPGALGSFLAGADGKRRRSKILAVGEELMCDDAVDELPPAMSICSASSMEVAEALDGLELFPKS
jgi:hypothetical protein